MCDHCAKVASQRNYAGQVTCKCDSGEKREIQEKSGGGCCGKKVRRQEDGCGGAKCCGGARVEAVGCCGANGTNRDKTNDTKRSCCK